jgi:hypothetical protein
MSPFPMIQCSLESSFPAPGSKACLAENSLVLAPVPVITFKALTKTQSEVAKSTSRAIASLLGTMATQNIFSRRTLFTRAVGTTISRITLAAKLFLGVPRSVVHGTMRAGEHFLGQADSTSGAIVGAHGTLASLSIVIFKALAFAVSSIACSFV